MIKKKTKNILFNATGGDFIDPTDTGSYIRYKTNITLVKADTPDKDYLRTDFTISLGDCTRVVSWDFEDYDDSNILKLDKIDAAIKIFNDARKDLIRAQKIAIREQKKIDKNKKNVKVEEKDGN